MSFYKIIDNFLTEQEYETLSNSILDKAFPWFWQESWTAESNDTPYFYHSFYDKNLPLSSHYELIENLFLKKLNAEVTISCRANLTLNFPISYYSGHIDIRNITGNTTAVYYFDTTDAKTVFSHLGREIHVDSIKNRLLIFEGNTSHWLIGHTDDSKPRRVVLNLNYIERNENII